MQKLNRRLALRLAAASALAAGCPALARAQSATQNWPSRFVKLVVPFTSGGGIDTIGRIVGARLSEIWGQQVVVENKPGAGGNIASEYVARSDPDGLTMYITAGGLAVNKFLFEKISYDPVADFAPVTLICLYPNLMVVPTSAPFRTVPELIAFATPKRAYYWRQPRGRRLFDLRLTGVALALCGAGLSALAAIAGHDEARSQGRIMFDAAADQFTPDHSPLDWAAIQVLRVGDDAQPLMLLTQAEALTAGEGLILGALARSASAPNLTSRALAHPGGVRTFWRRPSTWPSRHGSAP